MCESSENILRLDTCSVWNTAAVMFPVNILNKGAWFLHDEDNRDQNYSYMRKWSQQLLCPHTCSEGFNDPPLLLPLSALLPRVHDLWQRWCQQGDDIIGAHSGKSGGSITPIQGHASNTWNHQWSVKCWGLKRERYYLFFSLLLKFWWSEVNITVRWRQQSDFYWILPWILLLLLCHRLEIIIFGLSSIKLRTSFIKHLSKPNYKVLCHINVSCKITGYMYMHHYNR